MFFLHMRTNIYLQNVLEIKVQILSPHISQTIKYLNQFIFSIHWQDNFIVFTFLKPFLLFVVRHSTLVFPLGVLIMHIGNSSELSFLS